MVSSEDVLAALRAHWDDIWELLDEPSRARLRELAEDTAGDPERVVRRIVRLVQAALPGGHPVLELFDDFVRYARGADGGRTVDSGTFNGTVIQAGVAGLLRPASALSDDTPPDDADDWLLAADSVTAASYRADGHDPADPDLIRLTDRQGTVRLPSFQFDGVSGRPLPVVVAVNRLLDADDDPWGVADWWLGSNAWLDTVPARLLGTAGEHTLLAAARAEIAEW
ncbi:DUF3168 domain-containing protein [Kitasatospora sp. NPDC057692]|uniref:DUF3168 domain-containing protein n=1 Tax=Kitasatospora sp. NPDC057692 TaxID=3346215 RepID=UPI0036A827B3